MRAFIVLFSMVCLLSDASKDEDQSIYDCLSGNECHGAVSITHQGGVDYCCRNGHSIILEMSSGSDSENWFKFDQRLLADFLQLLLASGNKNKKFRDDVKNQDLHFQEEDLTEKTPDDVIIDSVFTVTPGILGTTSPADYDNITFPEEDASRGDKPKVKVESFVKDDHHPTSNYDKVRESPKDSTSKKGDSERGETTAYNEMENLVRYKIPGSDMDKLLNVFFPGSNLARRQGRRDVANGGWIRKMVKEAKQGVEPTESTNPKVVILDSFRKMVVTPDSWMICCLCNARDNPDAADLVEIITDFIKKLRFF